MFRRFQGQKILALLVAAGSSVACKAQKDCFKDERVDFLLDPEHPQVLITVRSATSKTVQFAYAAVGGYLEPEFSSAEPCRVVIYNYGENEPSEPWPMPGELPAGATSDYDFVVSGDNLGEIWVQEFITESMHGPLEGRVLVASCGTTSVEGSLLVSGICYGEKGGEDFFDYDFEVVTQQSPDSE